MNNFNYRFIFKTIGFLLIIESLCMMMATVVSFYYRETAGDAMLISSTITFFAGIFIRLIGTEDHDHPIGKRESFLAVSLTWVVLSAFGMLPFYLSGEIHSLTDAYFEAMSGLSSTGATVLENIDEMSKGLLFWRSLTQWIGGVGIIVFALVLLPMVGGNAAVLYDAEATGIVRNRFRPRIGQMAKRIFLIYVVVTLILIALLWVGPMNLFDSVCHALSTISTGGFSTKQESIAYWNSPYIEYVISCFMFIGGINFALIFFLLQGMAKKILKDEEFKWYFVMILTFTIVIAAGLTITGTFNDIEESFRTSLFQVTAIITTTSYSTHSFTEWGVFYSFAFSLLMPFCACAGSTSGGMKVVRLIVLCKNAINEFKRQVHPNAILPIRLNGNVVPLDVITKVLAFLFLYISILIISALVFSLSGMGFVESLGTSISSLSNIGIAFDGNGITNGYADIPVFSKWYMCFLMLVGRLELFTVLSLFMPAFWKR